MPEAPSPGHWCEVWPLLEALVGSPNIAVITTKHNHAPCLDSNFQYTTISPWAQTLQRRAFRPGFYRRTRTSRRSRTRPPAPASSSWWRQSPPCSTRASPVWKNAGLHCYCICACFFQWSTITSWKCLFVHGVCTNFSLNTHSVCTNFGLIVHSPVYSVILLK